MSILLNKDLTSFYKSWAPDKYGEKLDYSDAYKRVRETRQPVVTAEESPKGLRFKAVYPIMNGDEFLAMLNFEGGINSMGGSFKKEGIEFLHFLSPKHSRFFKKGAKIKDGYMLTSKSYIDKNFLDYVMSDAYSLKGRN